MTEDRASELIHRLKKLYYIPDLLLEDDIKRITDCIERQIPKKPIDCKSKSFCKCATCGCEMSLRYRYYPMEHYNYCPKCSQAIDWKGIGNENH